MIEVVCFSVLRVGQNLVGLSNIFKPGEGLGSILEQSPLVMNKTNNVSRIFLRNRKRKEMKRKEKMSKERK